MSHEVRTVVAAGKSEVVRVETIGLDQVEEAFQRMERGDVLRSVVGV